jgi:regulator of nucleoside diphosphate kinase
MGIRRDTMAQQETVVTDRDRSRIGGFLVCDGSSAIGSARSRFELEVKLEEADAIPVELTPRSLVTMNSTVALVDATTGDRRTVTLVYPDDRDLVPGSVGILQPLGQCLLGRSVGDVVEVSEGARRRRFVIVSITYQPEASGVSYL